MGYGGAPRVKESPRPWTWDRDEMGFPHLGGEGTQEEDSEALGPVLSSQVMFDFCRHGLELLSAQEIWRRSEQARWIVTQAPISILQP